MHGIVREVLADSIYNAAKNGFSFIFLPIPSKPWQGGQVGAIHRGGLNLCTGDRQYFLLEFRITMTKAIMAYTVLGKFIKKKVTQTKYISGMNITLNKAC